MNNTNPNKHIEEYLKYYCAMTNRPGYAVMLKGCWGTGKTWFINNFLKQNDLDGPKSIYISLNSISSIQGIENEFFKKLHPFLASKGVRIVGNIICGALKTSLNFDLNSDGKVDGNLSASVPKVDADSLLSKFEGDIIIFDDIERCSMAIRNLIGYINGFIEHDSYKVILIANEDEIKSDVEVDSAKGNYKKIKEKIIGKTFEVLPHCSSFLDMFVEEIIDTKTVKIINYNKDLIVNIYNASKCKNLRVLRHALQDASNVIGKIKDDYLKNNEFVSQLLNIYFIYSIEILNGNITPRDLDQFESSIFWTIKIQNNDDIQNNIYFKIIKKYEQFDIHNNILKYSTWQSFFEKGFVDCDALNNDISNTVYFIYTTQPEWVHLWRFQDLSDNEFDEYLDLMVSKWKNKQYCEIGEIFHVSGILFTLFEYNFIDFTDVYIRDHSIECISFLRKNRLLHNIFLEPSQSFFYNRDAWGGLGYHAYNHPDFIKLREYVDKELYSVKREVYKSVAEKIVALMISDIDEFKQILIFTSDGPNIYCDIPILQYVSVNKFTNAFIDLPSKNKQIVSAIFAERYARIDSESPLSDDKQFILNLIKMLSERLNFVEGKVSRYLISAFMNKTLINIIKILDTKY